MEFYVYLTYNCNLSCTYCSARKVVSTSGQRTISVDMVENVVEYIERNVDGDDDALVFFGGEPLLVPEAVESFINKTEHLNLTYRLFTNGLLIKRVPLELLKRIDVIFVSVDGDKRAHEMHRAQGTYDKIFENIDYLRSNTDSHIIGRVTVEEETDIELSVRKLLEVVHSVYWQIVNKPQFKNPQKFITRYNDDVTRLFSFWMEHLTEGENLNIIPFQAIVASIVFNYPEEKKSFRCGSGHSYQTIDIDGNVYFCDEYIGDSEGIVGNVIDGTVSLDYKYHEELFADCERCEVSKICLGRCRKFLSKYKDEHKRVYCDVTKHLINEIASRKDEITSLVDKYRMSLESIYPAPKCTEEIP